MKQREPEREEVIEPEEEPGTVLIPGSLPSERVAEPATEPERTGSPG